MGPRSKLGLLLAAAAIALPLPARAEEQPDGGARDAGPPASDDSLAPSAPAAELPPIRAEGGHILLELVGGAVRVTEVYVLTLDRPLTPTTPPAEHEGEGEMTADGGPSGPLSPDGGGAASEAFEPWIGLPEGAAGVEVERGGELWRPGDGGIYRAATIEPGRHALAFSFLVAAEEGRAVVTHALPFPVAGLHVMWPGGEGFSARAMGFGDSGTIQMGPRAMRVLERPMLEAGERLVVVTSMGEAPARGTMSRREPELRDPLGSLASVTLLLTALLLLGGMLLPYRTRWTGGR